MLRVGSKVIVTFLKEIKEGTNGRRFRKCSLGEPNKTERGTEYKNYNTYLYGDNIVELKDRTRIQIEEFGVDKSNYTDKNGKQQLGVNIYLFKFSIIDDVKPKQKEEAEPKQEPKLETKLETKLEPITDDDKLPF